MKIKELRSLSADALKARLSEIRLEYSIEKRKVVATGVSSKKAKIREMRRTVAQILTLLNERGAKV